MGAIRRTFWNAIAAAIATTKNPPIIRSTWFQEELKLCCSDGTQLAAQCWTASKHFSSAPPLTNTDANNNDHDIPSSSTVPTISSSTRTRTILCIHGWMDNCRSFYQLAPGILEQNQITQDSCPSSEINNYKVITLDLPGHGRSSHKSIDAPPLVQSELAFYVAEAIDCLQREGWLDAMPKANDANAATAADAGSEDQTPKITLIGHSLGAAVASLYAASFPEQIDQLILLDGAGFLARNAQDTPLHVRDHIQRRKLSFSSAAMRKKKPDTRAGYPSLEAAIQRRLQSSRKLIPGNQTSLSYETARELVLRATHLDTIPSEDEDQQVQVESTKKMSIQFRHDPRFAWPSIQYMTQEQNEGIFQSLGDSHVDCCILLAENGWPFRQHHLDRAVELIRPRTLRRLPGSHYFHADPDTSFNVVKAIMEFISTKEKQSRNIQSHENTTIFP